MLATLSGLHDTVALSNGVEMPRLGFGTFRIEPGEETVRAVSYALQVGYRSLDTAAMYANEEGVGEAVRESGLRRQDVFVATKVWNDDQGYDGTLAAFDRSLKRLDMTYVDLYLVHWPVEQMLHETWRAMERIYDEKLARAIGVCNYQRHHIEETAKQANLLPMVDQYEMHPRMQRPELREYCAQRGIQVEAWAPLMKGRVDTIPELVEIGKAHGKTAAQASLRWLLQLGVVTIPKSTHPQRIRENADLFDFELSEAEMARLASLDRGARM